MTDEDGSYVGVEELKSMDEGVNPFASGHGFILNLDDSDCFSVYANNEYDYFGEIVYLGNCYNVSGSWSVVEDTLILTPNANDEMYTSQSIQKITIELNGGYVTEWGDPRVVLTTTTFYGDIQQTVQGRYNLL